MAWLALAGAIALEICATVSLKTADGFTRLWPSVIVVIGYVGCFGLLGFALKTFDVGMVYAIWSAIGTAAITVIGVMLFGEAISVPRVSGLVLIIIGVVVLNLSGGDSHGSGSSSSKRATQESGIHSGLGPDGISATTRSDSAGVAGRPMAFRPLSPGQVGVPADAPTVPIPIAIPAQRSAASRPAGQIAARPVRAATPPTRATVQPVRAVTAPPQAAARPTHEADRSTVAAAQPALTAHNGLIPRQRGPRPEPRHGPRHAARNDREPAPADLARTPT